MRLEIDILHRQDDFILHTDITIEESATGIFGHSGSGKSTLLRCLAGLIKPSVGRIELDGEILFDSDRRIFVPPHKRRIGMVFQEPRLFPHWSVQKNLRAGKQKMKVRPPYDEKQVVELAGIAPLLDRSVQQLSGGEKQRVSLARTLLAYPRLLLMDEPLSALDSRLKARILPFLDRIHRELGIPCLYVRHDLSEILQLSDLIVLMESGSIVALGPLAEMAELPGMLDLIQEKDLNRLIGQQLHSRNNRKALSHEYALSH